LKVSRAIDLRLPIDDAISPALGRSKPRTHASTAPSMVCACLTR
jgi:hypothetical protein